MNYTYLLVSPAHLQFQANSIEFFHLRAWTNQIINAEPWYQMAIIYVGSLVDYP